MFISVSFILFSLFYSVKCENSIEPTTKSKCIDSLDDSCLNLTATIREKCEDPCGCDRIFIYDESKEDCVLNMEYLRELTKTKDFISADEQEVIDDEPLAKQLQETNEKVFRGLIGSAIFVICCATACVIGVCIYCFYTHYHDNQLRDDVETLRKKQENDDKRGLIKKSTKKMLDIKEESCNVMVGDTDIMCV